MQIVPLIPTHLGFSTVFGREKHEFIREPRQNAAAQAAGAAQDGSITTKSFHIPKLSMTPNFSKITVKDKHRRWTFSVQSTTSKMDKWRINYGKMKLFEGDIDGTF